MPRYDHLASSDLQSVEKSLQNLPVSFRSEVGLLLAIAPMGAGGLTALLATSLILSRAIPADIPSLVAYPLLLMFVLAARAAFVTGLGRMEAADEFELPSVWFPKTKLERPFYAAGLMLGAGVSVAIGHMESEVAFCLTSAMAFTAIFLGLTATNLKEQVTSALMAGLFLLALAATAFLACQAVSLLN